MQQKLFYINDYFIGERTIEVDILPNKYVDEQIEIDYFDFMDYMQTHGWLDGLGEMSLNEINLYTNIEVMPILHDYIVARHVSIDKVIADTELLVKDFIKTFKLF